MHCARRLPLPPHAPVRIGVRWTIAAPYTISAKESAHHKVPLLPYGRQHSLHKAQACWFRMYQSCQETRMNSGPRLQVHSTVCWSSTLCVAFIQGTWRLER